MISTTVLQVIAGASFLLLLTGLFMFYQDPVLEIYLANWGLC